MTTVVRWIVCDADCKARVVDVEDDGWVTVNPDSGLVAPVVVTVGFGCRLSVIRSSFSTHRNSGPVSGPVIMTAPPSRGIFRR